MGEKENGRARGRHACLSLARPFFLVPTTSKRLCLPLARPFFFVPTTSKRLCLSLARLFFLVPTTSKRLLRRLEKLKRCVLLRPNVAEKPQGMRLKFALCHLRTSTHESENMFVFFKRLRFYGEQDSVESNPVKLGGIGFNLVPRSHSGRGRSGYEIRRRLKRAL